MREATPLLGHIAFSDTVNGRLPSYLSGKELLAGEFLRIVENFVEDAAADPAGALISATYTLCPLRVAGRTPIEISDIDEGVGIECKFHPIEQTATSLGDFAQP